MLKQCEVYLLEFKLVSEEPGFSGVPGEMDSCTFGSVAECVATPCIAVPVCSCLLVSFFFSFSSDSALPLALLLAGLCVVASAPIFCSLSKSLHFFTGFSCPWDSHVKWSLYYGIQEKINWYILGGHWDSDITVPRVQKLQIVLNEWTWSHAYLSKEEEKHATFCWFAPPCG